MISNTEGRKHGLSCGESMDFGLREGPHPYPNTYYHCVTLNIGAYSLVFSLTKCEKEYLPHNYNENWISEN